MIGPKHILLIDDDEITNFINTRILLNAYPSIKIKDFLDAYEGLEYLRTCMSSDSHTPEIVLLDLNMPKITGWNLVEEIRKSFPNLKETCKIVILTSSNDPKEKEKAVDNDLVCGLLIKPLKIDHLEKILTD